MEQKRFLLKNMPRGKMLLPLAAAYPGTDLPAMEAFNALVGTSAEILSAMHSAFSRKGVSQARFRILIVLDRAKGEGLHPMTLAEALGVERATITGLVDGTEKAGLTVRRPCPSDRRSVIVALTPKGRRLMQVLVPERTKKISGLMGGLTVPEKKELTRLMDKVLACIPDFRKI